jgi:hypothetical protein
MNRFRVENNSVYEYSEEHGAYVFHGKLFGDETLADYLNEYDEADHD